MKLKYCQDVQIVCPDKLSQQLIKGFDDDINKLFSFQDGKLFDLSPNHSSKYSDQNVRLSQKLVKTCEDKCSKIRKRAFVHMILSHLSSGFAQSGSFLHEPSGRQPPRPMYNLVKMLLEGIGTYALESFFRPCLRHVPALRTLRLRHLGGRQLVRDDGHGQDE